MIDHKFNQLFNWQTLDGALLHVRVTKGDTSLQLEATDVKSNKIYLLVTFQEPSCRGRYYPTADSLGGGCAWCGKPETEHEKGRVHEEEVSS